MRTIDCIERLECCRGRIQLGTLQPTRRDQLLRRAIRLSVLSIVISALAGGTAVIVGLSTGTLSLLGFGFDAAIDSIASVALVWRFSIEAREPHRAERVEKVAEAMVGAALIVLGPYPDGSHPEAPTDSIPFEAIPIRRDRGGDENGPSPSVIFRPLTPKVRLHWCTR